MVFSEIRGYCQLWTSCESACGYQEPRGVLCKSNKCSLSLALGFVYQTGLEFEEMTCLCFLYRVKGM